VSCIPHSGGCERPATDALVNHLNWLEGSQFEHRACLDQIDRTRPQPECLYVDSRDAKNLVIERKSIAWPESHSHMHSKDHELANAIYERLAGVEFHTLYTLAMPSITSGSKAEFIEAGRSVAERIKAGYAGLQWGESIEIDCLGKHLSFRIRQLVDRGDNEPDSGVVIVWPMNWQMFPAPDLSNKLRAQVERIYAACVRKFAGYSDARRILMLDPHGEISFTSARTWNEFLMNNAPPDAINEIWIGQHGTDDFGEEEWVIEKVFGGALEFQSLLVMPVASTG
jgi:hypothetical protein